MLFENRRLFLARAAGLPLALPLLGAARSHVPVPKTAPRPEDVGTLDGIIAAFYDVISGPAGAPRQWGRDRTLYVAGVRFVSLGKKGEKVVANVYDHQTFVDAVDAEMVAKGFFEREIHRTTTRFGSFTHALSTYESRLAESGPVVARGVNSIQLFQDGKRWWIAGAVWDEERPDNPMTPAFLPGAAHRDR